MKFLINKKNLKFFILFLFIATISITVAVTYGEITAPNITLNNTQNGGVVDNIVYINDVEKDYYYYEGLNYTHSPSGTTPTTSNKNVYTASNLVQVTLTYSGLDPSNNLVGYVSNTELQNTYVYYKVYPVNNNGNTNPADDFVEIELIDNPFTNRPNNKGFNGWITDYVGASTSYNSDYYTRSVRIPVTYDSSLPQRIEITMNASWTAADIVNLSSSVNWTTAGNTLNDYSMQPVEFFTTIYEGFDSSRYYERVIIDYYDYYTGYYGNIGTVLSGRCYTWSGCTVYQRADSYEPTTTYYDLSSGSMGVVSHEDMNITSYDGFINNFNNTSNMAGYYEEVNIPRYSSLAGYYSNTGILQTSGTCNTSSGCTYYKLIQYYDDTNNVSSIDTSKTYYYLVTRDTNIIVMTTNYSSKWTTTLSKPFTLTSLNNGVDYRSSVTWNVQSQYITVYDDITIENMRITTNYSLSSSAAPSSSSTSVRYIYGNFNNLKLGRGLIRSGSTGTFSTVVGGSSTSNTGSSSNATKYKLIIESGFYSTIGVVNGASSSYRSYYVNARAVYGNDYDKVTGNNNNLLLQYCASGAWGGSVRSSSLAVPSISLTVKSGNFGVGEYDYTTGIYVGGRQGGEHYAVNEVKFEGGWVYNLIGGPLPNSAIREYNAIQMHMTGGSVDFFVGGAGSSATEGNRVVSITGGMVNYSVFGGSNGYNASGSDGQLIGDSFIYIGGKAEIGNPTFVNNNNTLYGAEAGSVFGIGNGRSTSSSIGSNDNSTIVIDGEAVINRNVYGGGNYGAVGVVSSSNQTSSTISAQGGTVVGSIYGGGNFNGSGTSSKTATINIDISGGTVNQNVFGGSRTRGTIYGNVNVLMNSGIIGNNLYGGGEGGYTNSSNPGTYVRGNVNVTIQDGLIQNNVYGGSAFGTVNAISNTTSVSSYNTNVTVNGGIVSNSVFAGGEGSGTYTPYVAGNAIVVVNNGVINNVFGGNDLAGQPNGTKSVYVNDGTINNVYGGGNRTDVNTSNVHIQGGTTTNVFGGSNETGTVNISNVRTTAGSVTNIYGGNNAGGVTNTSNVSINGADIGTVYGGGKLATTGITNVILNSSTVDTVYGGGESAAITTRTNVTLVGSSVGEIYGGSNVTGNVPTTNVYLNGGSATTVYGANNAGGEVTNTNVDANGGNIQNIYGGGNQAFANTTDVDINTIGSISNVFGGGRAANVTTTNVRARRGMITNIHGGSNQTGTVTNSNITTYASMSIVNIDNIYGGNNAGGTTVNSYVLINAGNISSLYGGNNAGGETTNSRIVVNNGTVFNAYGGNNAGGITRNSDVLINGGYVTNVYGGGESAVTDNSKVLVNNATLLGTVYGGGNNAGITNSSDVDVVNSSVAGNVFGGGNAGTIGDNTNLYVNNSTIGQSVFGGGNGVTAVVHGDTVVNVDGSTVINAHLFGGGNAAPTGTEEINASKATVNIAGALVHGNVYGGANTSVVYGIVDLNIGDTLVPDYLTVGNIDIVGTVFGGGEANAAGNENYDYSFISVTTGINIDIDTTNHGFFTIRGSIFGSGNASSTTGYSLINLSNYGTSESPQQNISVQRADIVTMDNSAIELMGATDRTNEYSKTLFSFSRINELKLKNNSFVYLRSGANLLEKVSSLVDGTSGEEKAVVNVSDTGDVTRNVDNRIYMLDGENLNIATNEQVTTYGEVNGMMFFGRYVPDRDDKPNTAMYSNVYNNGDTVPGSDLYAFSASSYVLGRHKTNHDITQDGFYTNIENEEVPGTIKVQYITPTPEDSSFYMWAVGDLVFSYEIDLVASKYSTLGTYELPLINYSDPNTVFSIVGFNYNDIPSDFELVNENNIPRISLDNQADNIMGLTMKSSNSGWITIGDTNFYTSDNPIDGTVDYISENSNSVPSLIFYLYHSKNLLTEGNIGTVTISMLAITPIDDLNSEVSRININVNLSRALYNTNDYEASMTVGEEFELFAPTTTDITSDSKLSAYYSLFVESEEEVYGTGYHRALTSTYILPENTKIMMVNLNTATPEYYYHVITAQDVLDAQVEYNIHGEVSYYIRDFIRMGSTSVDNHFDEVSANEDYYNETIDIAHEEFIFIVDFAETNITTDHLENKLLLELRNAEDQTLINVLGVQHANVTYNLYANKNAIIDLNANLSSDKIYLGENLDLNVNTNFLQQTFEGKTIYDTNYFGQKLGIKISLYDNHNNLVNGVSLLGVTYTYNGVTYYPRVDGTVRINIAERVANVYSKIKINTTHSNLSSGSYTMRIESFGSSDGIYYGLESSDIVQIPIIIINNIFGLDVNFDNNDVIVEKTTGLTTDNNNSLVLDIDYESGLADPNIRVSLYRRKYDTIYNEEYELVNYLDYFASPMVTNEAMEYTILDNPIANQTLFMYFRTNLVSGTYRLTFSLYDGNTYIGEIYKYLIIK